MTSNHVVIQMIWNIQVWNTDSTMTMLNNESNETYFDQIYLIGFYFVTCCFNIFTCIKTRVLSPTPHTNSRRRAFARNVESVFIA